MFVAVLEMVIIALLRNKEIHAVPIPKHHQLHSNLHNHFEILK